MCIVASVSPNEPKFDCGMFAGAKRMQNGGLRTKRAYPIREKEDLFQLWLFLRLWDSPRIGKGMQFSLYIVRIEICTSTTTITARKMPKVG